MPLHIPVLVPAPVPRMVATPTPRPTLMPEPELVTPTPQPSPALRDLAEKRYMLQLINQERGKAGVPPVVLGNNPAAQIHAEASLAGCASGHWSLDGLKPWMRYSLAGGYHYMKENVAGNSYCVTAEDGFRRLTDHEEYVRRLMAGWVGSPGHRATMVDPHVTKVSIGLAWDTYDAFGVQVFETDYVEYEQSPTLEDGVLRLAGRVSNGAILRSDRDLGVRVYYDPPPRSLTRGQIARTYSVTLGVWAASLRYPAPPGMFWPNDESSRTLPRGICLSPYDVPESAQPPSSYQESKRFYKQARADCQALLARPGPTIQAPLVTARVWHTDHDRFRVEADLQDILARHGPGVYTVLVGADALDGERVFVSWHSVFHEVPRPTGYD